jgi:hypothetical protein
VQRFIADVGTTPANVAVGCLSSVFMWAKRTGRTTYNPTATTPRRPGSTCNEFLGNTPGVASKHYARRERKVVPLTLKRGGLGN